MAGSSSAGKERSIQKSLQSPTISLCLHLVTDPFLYQSSLQEEFNAKFILLEVKPYSKDEGYSMGGESSQKETEVGEGNMEACMIQSS